MNNMKKASSHSLWIPLALICISLWVRLFPLPASVQWQDTGTELLSAYHVSSFHEFSLLGIRADSINFYHPPWYLWILGGALYINPNPLVWIYSSAIVHALTIIPVYAIGSIFGGIIGGTIAGLLYALWPQIVELAWTLQSQNSIVPVTIWILWVWIYARQRKSLILLLISGILLVFATTVNYAAWGLVWIPLLVSTIDYRANRTKQLVWIAAWILSIILFYSPLWIYFKTSALVEIVLDAVTHIPHTQQHHWNIFLPLIALGIAVLCASILRRSSSNLVKFIVSMLLIAVAGIWIQQLSSISKKGDYADVTSCARMTHQIIVRDLQNAPTKHIRFSQIDPTHNDNWSNIWYLIEMSLDAPFVQLDRQKGTLVWESNSDTTYTLCITPRTADTQSFLETVCPAHIQKNSPSGNLTRMFSAYPEHPCSVYRNERTQP